MWLIFIFIVLLTGAGLFIVSPKDTSIWKVKNKSDFKLGLDLRGGSHLEYEGDLSEIAPAKKAEALEALRGAIERRIQSKTGGGLGVDEPLIQVSGDSRLIVQLPGVTDVKEATKVIGQTPFLEFREQKGDGTSTTANPEDWQATGLTGRNLEIATVEFDPQSGKPVISLKFNEEGSRLFEEITARNVGKPLAVFLDGLLLQAPTVQQAIAGGQAVITGTFTIQESKAVASRLNSGALPVPIKLVGQQTVGATLGANSLQKSLLAGLLGFVAIFLFMVIYYRLPGLLASLALTIYIILSLAVFKLLGVTLTLAGIAGFVLSIGMAVDANILIFERVKEELRAGKELNLAIQDGFNRAWLSIRDSNASTLITTFILGYFGTSIIRAFAVTLALGVIISMFTAITITRTFLLLALGRRIKVFTHRWLYGV